MSQTNQATNPVSDSSRGVQYRVLIVEDDADIRELIRYNLAQEGFVVEEAADGAQALERVRRRVPDLMVLDLMLPGMPGLQICRQMRVERETAHLPILIVTAKGTEVDKVLGLEMDFGTYQVFVDAKKRELALREFELLKFFVQHPMRVYTREQLLDMVWGRDTFVEPRTVDVHVRRLRQHIERDDANPELILTVRSVGYRFNPEALG